MDLAKIYKSIAEKLCPNAVITVDRFHVSKLLHEELNQGRIEQKKTAESLKSESREKVLGNLKGCKYILLKRSGFGFRNFDNFQKRSLLVWHLTNN